MLQDISQFTQTFLNHYPGNRKCNNCEYNFFSRNNWNNKRISAWIIADFSSDQWILISNNSQVPTLNMCIFFNEELENGIWVEMKDTKRKAYIWHMKNSRARVENKRFTNWIQWAKLRRNLRSNYSLIITKVHHCGSSGLNLLKTQEASLTTAMVPLFVDYTHPWFSNLINIRIFLIIFFSFVFPFSTVQK